ncbi:MAG: patatin-like phospholipase family protein [Bacteroides graminisolvens]|jgi:Predicted esterase of the alpha-beta hydrolase superfamily|nr:patatin-like phospholipase family protein [Bacteroides graminisolvens]
MENNSCKYNLGLVLSGGGAKGFAHLGAFKALRERNIMPDIISGTSAGALAGAFIADGYSPEEILHFFDGKTIKEFTEINTPGIGLFNTRRLFSFIKKHLRAKRFEDLHIPLIVTATDFDNGISTHFSEGLLVAPLVASCSVPIVFTPTIIDGKHYVDGGLFQNLPASVIRHQCKKIIGINLNPIYLKKHTNSLKGIAEKSLHCIFNSNTASDKKLCDTLIEPEGIWEHPMYDLKHAEKIFSLGYKAVEK